MKRLLPVLLLTAVFLAGCQAQPEETHASAATGAVLTPTAATEASEPTAATQGSTVPEEEDLAFVQVTLAVPGIVQDLRFARENPLTGQALYPCSDAWLRSGTAQKLAAVCKELARQDLGLMLWDAYRTPEAQLALATLCPDPVLDSSNCTGSAVDVQLIRLSTGEPLPMPSDFTELSGNTGRLYQNCPLEAIENAWLLEAHMISAGFIPDPDRWWHYTDTVQYPEQTDFQPAKGFLWASTEDICLYDSTFTHALCQVSTGDTLTLLAYMGEYALVSAGNIQGYAKAGTLLPLNPESWSSNLDEELYLYRQPSVGSGTVTAVPADQACIFLGWNYEFALMSYQGRQGYARAQYIQPADPELLAEHLDTVPITDCYTYQQMCQDLAFFAAVYQDCTVLDSIGTSEEGREIPVLRIGAEDARYHVLVQAAIHGREHMTAWLATALADYWLDHNLTAYGDICFHIIPMSNPDGVTVSQTQTLTEAQEKIWWRDYAYGHTEYGKSKYAALWKANALGVDLNRNFDVDWYRSVQRSSPSAERYKGEAPFCAAESIALRDYTLSYDFDVTISYHSEGSVIFYEYGDKEPVNTLSESLALAVNRVTGFDLKDAGSSGGYKDWAIDVLEIPSLTIEVGCSASPLPAGELYSVFFRNLQVLPTIAQWLQANDQ